MSSTTYMHYVSVSVLALEYPSCFLRKIHEVYSGFLEEDFHSFTSSKGRIFSAYLRPWALYTEDSSPHVPLLTDIDILVSDELLALATAKEQHSLTVGKRRRLRGKQTCSEYGTKPLRYTYTDKEGKPLRRSYAEAWKDYRCKHVVSKWAAKIIRQWNASHLADSLEALEEDDRHDSKRQRDPIDGSWMDLNAVRDILQNSASAERRSVSLMNVCHRHCHCN